jgi:hypothetical protein
VNKLNRIIFYLCLSNFNVLKSNILISLLIVEAPKVTISNRKSDDEKINEIVAILNFGINLMIRLVVIIQSLSTTRQYCQRCT